MCNIVLLYKDGIELTENRMFSLVQLAKSARRSHLDAIRSSNVYCTTGAFSEKESTGLSEQDYLILSIQNEEPIYCSTLWNSMEI